MCLFVCLFVCLLVCLLAGLFACLLVFLFVCLFGRYRQRLIGFARCVCIAVLLPLAMRMS